MDKIWRYETSRIIRKSKNFIKQNQDLEGSPNPGFLPFLYIQNKGKFKLKPYTCLCGSQVRCNPKVLNVLSSTCDKITVE